MIYTEPKIEYGYGFEWNQRELIINDGVDDISILFDIGFYSRDLWVEKINKKFIALNLPIVLNFMGSGEFQLTGISSYTIDLSSSASVVLGLSNSSENFSFGLSYFPPFLLQSYLDKIDNEELRYPKNSMSACGQNELLFFGSDRYINFEIQYEGKGTCGSVFSGSVNGLNGLRNLMEYMIRKKPIMFYKDYLNNDFILLELDSTEKSKDGNAYELKEMIDMSLQDVFRTGILKFRVINEECNQ